jgi:hypothetical protein
MKTMLAVTRESALLLVLGRYSNIDRRVGMLYEGGKEDPIGSCLHGNPGGFLYD